MTLSPGDRLGPYEVLALLGAGGMGEVYRALDPRLGRQVAIKVLHPDKLSDDSRRQRFVQEARAASALNHPNIVTIHDIGTENEMVYMVMELIEGQSLDKLIPATGLSETEVLRIATQIADAFGRAHAAGIVHRDLKPANVMRTPDGLVKVLDFGLAKLVEPSSMDAEATRTIAARTVEGTVLGTPAYMSPEQAKGKPLDARSDIFSFGALLYELCAGMPAFRGETHISILASVLREEPQPLAAKRPDLSPELTRLILRCLRKDASRRAQSMADLKVALAELKEESSRGQLSGAVPAVAPPAPPPASSMKPSSLEASASQSSPSSAKRPIALWAGIVVAVLAVVGFFAWRTYNAGPAADAVLQPTPFTSYPGNERGPSFSPDGNQVVFSWDGEQQGNSDIYVKLIGTESPLRLTTNPSRDFEPHWSPDGRTIAFLRLIERDRFAVMLVPPLGGSERTVAQFFTRNGLGGQIASMCWTLDSRQLIVSGSQLQGQTNRLLLLSVDSGEVKTLAQLDSLSEGYATPELSPDGRTLLALSEQGSQSVHLWPVSRTLELGKARILDIGSGGVQGIAWTADGRDLVFSPNVTSPVPLSRISASGGEPRPLAWTGPGGGEVAISSTQNRMVFTRSTRDTNLWEVSLGKLAGNESNLRMVAGSSFREVAPDYSRDGKRLVFYSNRGGSVQIWTADANGEGATQLTSMNPRATTGTPRWSPDDKRISFDSDATGIYQIYVISANGGQPRALTTGPSSNFITSWSADGRWIYFTSNRSGDLQIWRVLSEGGNPEQVTRNGGEGSYVSPDGKWLYFTKKDGTEGLWRMPLSGGEETRVADSVYRYNYALTANGVYWVPREKAGRPLSIRYLDLASGASREIVKIQKEVDLGLAVSPDGQRLLFAQRDYFGMDLMLVENFR